MEGEAALYLGSAHLAAGEYETALTVSRSEHHHFIISDVIIRSEEVGWV